TEASMSVKSIERLAERLGIASGSRRIGRTTLVRLTAYYLAVLGVVAGLILATDNMRGTVSNGGRSLAAPDAATIFQGLWSPLFSALPPLGTGAAAVITSFLLAIPVAFTYVRTRTRLKYDQSLVQTVIMLPVVVTAILIV